MNANEIRNMLVDEIDFLDKYSGFYWTYERSLKRFICIVGMAYELKAINKNAYNHLINYTETEYKERFKKSIYE